MSKDVLERKTILRKSRYDDPSYPKSSFLLKNKFQIAVMLSMSDEIPRTVNAIYKLAYRFLRSSLSYEEVSLRPPNKAKKPKRDWLRDVQWKHYIREANNFLMKARVLYHPDGEKNVWKWTGREYNFDQEALELLLNPK